MTDTQPYEHLDRRMTARRREDFFWLKRLADLTGEACLALSRDLAIQYIDDKVFDLLGTPAPHALPDTLADLTRLMAQHGFFGHGDPSIYQALIQDQLVNQRLRQDAATQIIKTVTARGRYVDLRVSLGRDDGYLILLRDVTDSEIQSRALDTALKIGGSGYWFYNIQTKDFSIRTDSLQSYFSKSAILEIERKGFRHTLHKEDLPVVDRAMDEAIKNRTPAHCLVRVIGDLGPVRWLDSHIMPNLDERGLCRSVTCFFTDITQQVEDQETLRAAKQEAEAALAAKNIFLGRLSHEVRTPLNAVIGMADALVHSNATSDISPQLSLIQNSAEKVLDMVDGTLEHAKLSDEAVELDLKVVNPCDVVQTVCKQWKAKADAGNVNLKWSCAPDVPAQALMDDYRYEQCLSNLLSNAIKFSEGGSIQVLLAMAGEGPARKMVLAVRDTGIGMAQSALTDIFEPFKQADNTISGRFGGTGLGLSIVKDLVELMGGRIDVNSQVGKGTLFAISIPEARLSVAPGPSEATPPRQQPTAAPVAQAPAAPAPTEPKPVQADTVKPEPVQNTPAPAQPSAKPDNPFEGLSVLIVDDNATNHIVASSLLSRVVGDIDTALNGREALDKLAAKPYDLVLMDIHMPVMDGIETTIAIRTQPSSFQSVPIIALTADPQYQQARICRNIGMNSSLGKPIKLASLLEAFDDVLFGESRVIATAA